jgi:hypothetical protein
MMDNTILDDYSRAFESMLRLQEVLLRNWSNQWSLFRLEVSGPCLTETQNPARTGLASSLSEQISSSQKKWSEAVSDVLRRHQETLDEQYRAGIRAIDDAFRMSEAKDPEQFRHLGEDLWRRNIDVLNTALASQMHDVQSIMHKLLEAATASTICPKGLME